MRCASYLGDYIVRHGCKYFGCQLREVPTSYVHWLYDKLLAGEEIRNGLVLDFLDNLHAYHAVGLEAELQMYASERGFAWPRLASVQKRRAGVVDAYIAATGI